MPRKYLTEESVNSLKLPPKGSKLRYWDSGHDAVRGLHVLVSHLGTRSYRVTYRFPSSTKEYAMLLGRVGDVTLAEARDKAREARKAIARGLDPKAGDP